MPKQSVHQNWRNCARDSIFVIIYGWLSRLLNWKKKARIQRHRENFAFLDMYIQCTAVFPLKDFNQFDWCAFIGIIWIKFGVLFFSSMINSKSYAVWSIVSSEITNVMKTIRKTESSQPLKWVYSNTSFTYYEWYMYISSLLPTTTFPTDFAVRRGTMRMESFSKCCLLNTQNTWYHLLSIPNQNEWKEEWTAKISREFGVFMGACCF